LPRRFEDISGLANELDLVAVSRKVKLESLAYIRIRISD
jgi:hypothetical protein